MLEMKRRKTGLALLLAAVVLIAISLAVGLSGRSEAEQRALLIFAFTVTAVLLIAAVCLRTFMVPRFQYTPGKIQILLEDMVELFDDLARRSKSGWRAVHILATGAYLFFRTLRNVIREHKRAVILWIGSTLVLLAGALLIGSAGREESVQEAMRDAVLHGTNRISLFGLKEVNPGLISAFTVTAALLIGALLIRVFVIPRFQYAPGKFQLLLEEAVGLFDNMARSSSPHRNRFLAAYIFSVGAYIFVGTLFELLGLQVLTAAGHPITLPAPLSDVNAAIATGTLSYLIILSGGIAGNGAKGIGKTLKEYSLPISMSFRLFGALLSGLLVTELVYYYVSLSFVLPVLVGVMFTLLHALIQTYVLTMLTAMYYGEVTEPDKPKETMETQVPAAQA